MTPGQADGLLPFRLQPGGRPTLASHVLFISNDTCRATRYLLSDVSQARVRGAESTLS